MITEFCVRAEVDNDVTLAIGANGTAEVPAALSIIDLAVLSVLVKETAASVDRALAVAKNAQAEAEAEQRLRDKGILQ